MYTESQLYFNLPKSQCFLRALYLEKKRSERSGRGFAVLLLEFRNTVAADLQSLCSRTVSILNRVTRDTDFRGWYTDGSVMGVLFTEFGLQSAQAAADILTTKITSALAAELNAEQMAQISLSSYVQDEHPVSSVFEAFDYPATEAIQLVENNAETKVLN